MGRSRAARFGGGTAAALLLALAATSGVATLGMATLGMAAEVAGPPASAAPPKPPPPPPLQPSVARPPAVAKPPRDAGADAASYQRCMTLAKDDPGAARDMAERWQGRGGAHPADHCFAVALLGLQQYKEGATRLEKLAEAMTRAPVSLRAEVLGQAAQGWLLDGNPARAYAAAGAALSLRPDDAELLLDRAEAAGIAGWFDKAVADLNRVLKSNPKDIQALIYRASSYRALNQLDRALADVEQAVKLSPDSVAALLERGDIRRLRGDLNGAREDWIRVSELAPGSSADAAAKTNIERLELKEDVPAPEPTPASKGR